ncbi:hypothetical protein GCM10008995_14450 [Halobellus salinus]|uniref:LarA-like N-terminal domain-containing protein n=1 Tax=Halobellus salinus TaxID=931585 RepID=A0A830EMM7_9EURY|nr:lactate racemase domain-containing protein [Halobellus salinus]GGJ05767.1 hypothetical protein GCM10008995_14450 [Halobellus salinus]SMP23757.1 protein of unknown function [Halobellus salinus]
MEFPDAETVDATLPEVTFPTFARVSYDPETPEIDDVRAATHDAVASLPLSEVPAGGTVAVGLGSRGIHDIKPIAETVITDLSAAGYDPVVVPAMGSHGGSTAAGQRRTLAALGLTEDALGCPVDARMDAEAVGTTDRGHGVPVATAALEADGIVVVNRVKPHTNFSGRVESGVSKMLTVGLGKRAGARSFHEAALTHGYVDTIERALGVVRDNAPVIGGVAVVENVRDRTAHVEGIPAVDLPDAEAALLERATEYLPTLPFDDLDALVVEQIGKDVSGSGMDTNVIGRYGVVNAADPPTPDIDRIIALGLTDATHGNGHGIGLADVTTAEVAAELDLDQMYTNALTSGSLSRSSIPVVLPSDRHALRAAVATAGDYDPDEARIAWARDTAHLSSFRVSEALLGEVDDAVTVERYERLTFDGGDARFAPVGE